MENQSLFEVKVNSQGAEYIRKFARVANLVIVTAFIFSLIVLYSEVKFLVSLAAYIETVDNAIMVNIIISSLKLMATFVNFVSVYYYVSFSRKINEALKNVDEQGFNQSFKLIYRNSLIFFGLIVFDSITWLLNLLPINYEM